MSDQGLPPRAERVRGGAPLCGRTRVPGDKSISHRALLFAAIAEGRSHIRGLLDGRDCRATLALLPLLGATPRVLSPTEVEVQGCGLEGLREPPRILDCDNSGTTIRLLAGLLAGRPFMSILTGRDQLQRRPMLRVVAPLRAMGALILGRDEGARAPLALAGTQGRCRLRGMEHRLSVASAQVKSALLLAGLSAEGETSVVEPGPARDHTERMLRAMGAPIRVDGRRVTIVGASAPLRPLAIKVPGDPSSAAFLLVAASIIPGSDLTIKGVGLNETRNGILAALGAMGADITVSYKASEGGEPVADLHVRHAELRGAKFGGERIVTMIDEIPILAVAACLAVGRTEIRDAQELRVKESDRIAATAAELRALGANVEELPDGLAIEGPTRLRGATVASRDDHRLAMALIVAGLAAEGETLVLGTEVTGDSFPGFEDTLRRLGGELTGEPLKTPR